MSEVVIRGRLRSASQRGLQPRCESVDRISRRTYLGTHIEHTLEKADVPACVVVQQVKLEQVAVAVASGAGRRVGGVSAGSLTTSSSLGTSP
jgi:hypothetical protein